MNTIDKYITHSRLTRPYPVEDHVVREVYSVCCRASEELIRNLTGLYVPKFPTLKPMYSIQKRCETVFHGNESYILYDKALANFMHHFTKLFISNPSTSRVIQYYSGQLAEELLNSGRYFETTACCYLSMNIREKRKKTESIYDIPATKEINNLSILQEIFVMSHELMHYTIRLFPEVRKKIKQLIILERQRVIEIAKTFGKFLHDNPDYREENNINTVEADRIGDVNEHLINGLDNDLFVDELICDFLACQVTLMIGMKDLNLDANISARACHFSVRHSVERNWIRQIATFNSQSWDISEIDTWRWYNLQRMRVSNIFFSILNFFETTHAKFGKLLMEPIISESENYGDKMELILINNIAKRQDDIFIGKQEITKMADLMLKDIENKTCDSQSFEELIYAETGWRISLT